jgi:HAD superfamily hydrolase (TIGR01509 family)
MIDSVIFDMDGVLFDTERLYGIAWDQAGALMHLHDISSDKKHCVGLNGVDIRKYLLQKYGPDFPIDRFRKAIDEAFHVIVQKEGLPKKEGVDEILLYLKEHDYRIGLATSSGQQSALTNLNSTGIAHYFQTVITGDMVVNGKPHPEIYQTACAKLGANPKNTIAIEDSPNGVKSSHAAGLNVIMVPDIIVPTAENEKLLFQKFDSLLDVKKFLEYRK